MSRCWIHKGCSERTLHCDQISNCAGRNWALQIRVANTRILVTNSNVTQRESSGTTPRLDLLWTCCFPNNVADTELRSKIDSLANNLVSSKAGVLNGMLRSFLLIAPIRCESTQADWAQVDLLRLSSRLCDKALHHPVNKMMRTFPSTSEIGKSHQVLARPSTRATAYQKMLSFRSCSHCLTVFVMSLIIVITIRIGRPVLVKKIAQSFADSLSTDPSPSDMCIDIVAW